MNNIYIVNIFRFLFLLFVQGLVLQFIGFKNIQIYIYPIFIMLLPLEITHGILVLLGFLMGLGIDVYYNGYGLHTAVMTLLAFSRPIICVLLEPRGGFEVGQSLNKHSLGFRWFFRYSSIITLLHISLISILGELKISWFILASIVLGYIFSMILILLYQFIFNPKV